MEDPYNGKVLLAAVICLSVVIIFVILLHVYGRWLLRRSRAAYTNSELTDFHRHRRSSADEVSAVGAAISSGDVGLDSAAVAALPLFIYTDKEQNGRMVDCVVCLSAMEEGEKGRFLPRCGHGFHVRCIDVWLSGNSTCPICRMPAAAAAAMEEEDEYEVVLVESNDADGEVSEVVVEIDDGEKEEVFSSSSSSSPRSSLVNGSLMRMLSRSRSDKRVFPSVVEN